MLIGTLECSDGGCNYAWYEGDSPEACFTGQTESPAAAPPAPEPDCVVVRVPFGGCEFLSPARIDDAVIERIEQLVPQSPRDLAPAVRLIRAARHWWPARPTLALFDTAFFASAARGVPLGVPEYVYAIDPELACESGLCRLGYEGILHDGACSHVRGTMPSRAGVGSGLRILSICLEPRPEVAGVVDGRPVMVTGGTGRLGGLPGETSCGDLDPTIVLLIANGLGMSVQEVETELACRSGLAGLVGRPIRLPDLFTDLSAANARAIFEYRLRQACGAAVASMGGVDGVVFSGRYHDMASHVIRACLADWIGSLAHHLFSTPRSRVMAALALSILA